MMTKQTEALKMAIEAMERAEEVDWELNSLHVLNILQAIQACKEALAQPLTRDWKETINERIAKDDAFKQALEQPAQESVAWISVKDKLPKEIGRYLVYVEEIYDLGNAHYIWNAGFNTNDGIFQEETIKGATVTHWMNLPNTPNGISHYINPTHPAPTWQGLSDDERFIIVQNADWDNPNDIAELIEQALKTKNGKV